VPVVAVVVVAVVVVVVAVVVVVVDVVRTHRALAMILHTGEYPPLLVPFPVL